MKNLRSQLCSDAVREYVARLVSENVTTPWFEFGLSYEIQQKSASSVGQEVEPPKLLIKSHFHLVPQLVFAFAQRAIAA
jgi:hypothetical protein